MSSSGAHPQASVVLGVGGGIAAYKACELLRRLREAGHEVRVIPTAAALEFVGAATFEALSGQPVHTGVFRDVPDVPHVRLGQQADLVVVAPATADLLARSAHGLADDLLTSTLLTARCPVLMVPAMHTEMWQHPACVANVETLRAMGVTVAEPAAGRLTGADSGRGRLPEAAEIAQLAELLLEHPRALPHDMAGMRVLVSTGGTREPLDPVRYLGNRSSGRQGLALAQLAAQRGAEVHLVAAHTDVSTQLAGVDVTTVRTAAGLHEEMLLRAPSADVVVMAAAVADFRPARNAEHKIKKNGETPEPVELTTNPDVLRDIVTQRDHDGGAVRTPLIVGFAAETGDETADVLTHAKRKLVTKGCDLLAVNAVGEGQAFETEDNAGWILHSDGSSRELSRGSKHAFAAGVLDTVVTLRTQ